VEKLFRHGPEFNPVLRQDEYLVKLRRNVMKFFNKNFEAAVVYIQKFEFIEQFVTENKEKSQESIESETGIVYPFLKKTYLLALKCGKFQILESNINKSKLHA
jgi:hypothetical protein